MKNKKETKNTNEAKIAILSYEQKLKELVEEHGEKYIVERVIETLLEKDIKKLEDLCGVADNLGEKDGKFFAKKYLTKITLKMPFMQEVNKENREAILEAYRYSFADTIYRHINKCKVTMELKPKKK